MKLAICGDHRGYELKNELIKKIKLELGYECVDCGTNSNELCDYPPLAFKVGELVSKNECDLGIVICGSGDGMNMAVNKVKGIRCTLVVNKEDAKRAKQHINANVLALGSEKTDLNEAIEIVKMWINTSFLEDRYRRRLNLVEEYERKH